MRTRENLNTPFFIKEFEPSNLLDLKSLLKEGYKRDFLVFLDTSRVSGEENRHFYFIDPVKILLFKPGDDLAVFFRKLEEALSEGLWLAGFFSYEFGYFLDKKLTSCYKEPHFLPLVFLAAFKHPQIFEAKGVCFGKAEEPELQNLKLSLAQEEYISKIRQIKGYIASGDTYQVNFTMKYHFSFKGDTLSWYLALRRKQRVSYGALIKTPEFQVLSFSPELFIRVKEGNIFTRPMKGTASRGDNLSEDEKLAAFLSSDTKNQAENVMIVDLLRNDLGRVCEKGSVWVPKLFEVEKYETVLQMTSTVKGKLKNFSLLDIFKALFPCGSVTGAPKIRTMEIISELETEPRGVYTGAIGFISPQKEMVFNVAIRTLALSQGQGEFGIGSGIVWDSNPEKEYEESLLKAKFLKDKAPYFELIETIRFDPGEDVKLLSFHLSRLKTSAAYFGFPLDEKALLALLQEVFKTLDKPAKLRLLLREDGRLKLEAYPLPSPPKEIKIALVKKDYVPPKKFLLHKTTYRHWFNRWQDFAKKNGLFEVVFYDKKERLLEGTISNIFLQINGKLYTPPAKLGLLPGVLRESLLSAGKAYEKELYLADLYQAEKIFVGNTVRGLLAVSHLFKK
ncbi:aminodeoxychorismate synthase component I [Thermodesulfatator indicus]